jgi:hypothetical protein
MSGFVFVGGEKVPNSYVPDGQMIQIAYTSCRQCLGEGVIRDGNGEPMAWCGCTTGEAVQQVGNAGGAA